VNEPVISKCKICAKDIPPGAKKCTECGEFQSALSRVLAGLDLKGLSALLPLLTLIYAFLSERIEGQRSEILIGAPRCEITGVTVFASNLGNRHGLIQAVKFSATETEPGGLVLPEDDSVLLLDPGSARMISFGVPDSHANGLVSFPGQQKPDCTVSLEFDILNFDQSAKRIDHRCGCPSS